MLSVVQEVDCDWTTSDTPTTVGLLVARQLGEDLTLVLLFLFAQRRTATADPLKHISGPYRSFSDCYAATSAACDVQYSLKQVKESCIRNCGQRTDTL